MRDISPSRPDSTLRLWGLIQENRYADSGAPGFGCLFSKSHFTNGNRVEGLLLFSSPWHAEIYCRRLHALGDTGWRLCGTDDADFTRIMASVRDEQLKLWIVLGFSASETQQLLLDEQRLPMTSSVGLEVGLQRDEEGAQATLRFPAEAVPFLKTLIYESRKALTPNNPTEVVTWVEREEEGAWSERAAEALERIGTMPYVDYQRIWGNDQPTVALALFDPMAREWLFFGDTAACWH
jgi:hypothetical protein